MNGAILDFNLLLGEVALVGFILYVHVLRRCWFFVVWTLYTWSGLTFFFLLIFCAAFSLDLWMKQTKEENRHS